MPFGGKWDLSFGQQPPERRIAVLAGRRIDGSGQSSERFPQRMTSIVSQRLESKFKEYQVGLLVCSAACGADLVALEIAIRRGIDFKIVLPYAADKFRRTSVIDRPGEWGEIFDKVVYYADKRGNLINLNLGSEGEKAFSLTTHSLFDTAHSLMSGLPPFAFVVWEGRPRSGPDATAEFKKIAEDRHLEIIQVLTV